MRLHFSNFTFYLLCGLALLLAACEKEVTLVPNTLETRLVVEGTIENGAAPVVILTRSLAYFNSLQPQDLINAFVLDARVTVSNGSQTTTLTPVNVTVPGGQV
ncbi:MAG TPA: hypothetical protein PKD90_09805, partial [Phnomibacter sp.]|nr:hypothetical protein [Phnomibacter sp.]